MGVRVRVRARVRVRVRATGHAAPVDTMGDKQRIMREGG